jgi:hypothetical protein
MLRRVAIVLAGAVIALVVGVYGFFFALRLNFHPAPPSGNYPAPASPLQAQQQDVDDFSKAIALDRSFSPVARAAADARLASLRSLPDALPLPKLHVALMQVMALADNGHSRVSETTGDGTLMIPLDVKRFADGFYVTRAAPAYSDMLGGRVQSIDGHPIDQVLTQLDTLRGGIENFRRQNDANFIVVQDLLYGLGIAADPKASTWTVALSDGRTVTHRVDAFPMHKGSEQDWSAYQRSSVQLPETWRHDDQPFRLFPAEDSCAQVVRLQSIGDVGDNKIAPFLVETEAALRAKPPCAVILDLRGDDGGDYTNTWHFTHALPHLLAPGGHIFVLTDSVTFSAAITTVAFVKDAGGDKVSIIGEPVGDRLSFFSEGTKACLPNLKVCVFYQRAKHDYAHACDNVRDCFWLNWFYPVRAKSLQPDIVVPLTFADWSAGRDAAYDTARRLAAQAVDKR